MSRNLMVIGTGTDIGKTYVTALIVKKLADSGRRAAYYKAAMSGNVRDAAGKLIPGDAAYVRKTAGIQEPLSVMCPFVYEHAVSPHLASRLEGSPVRYPVVREGFEALSGVYDFVTMEGSGGILCPLCEDEERLTLEDVIRRLALPCLLVADAGLGTINAVGLTASYMKEKKIPLVGIIFNHYHPGDILEEDNLRMCEKLTGVPVTACVKDDDKELTLDAEKLAALYC